MDNSNVIETTIEILGHHHSEAASAILVHGLTVFDEEIKNNAARTLLFSGSGLRKTEIIRNINELSPEMIQDISQHVDLIRFPLHECLDHGNTELAIRALETIKIAKLYSELPIILNFIRSTTEDVSEQVDHVYYNLINDLYDQQKNIDSTLDDPQEIKNKSFSDLYLEALAKELLNFERIKRPQLLIESLLILAHPGKNAARQLIRESTPECLTMVWSTLRENRHPGVLNFLSDCFSLKYMHAGFISIVSGRTDIEFQLHFIDSIPSHPTSNQEQNYKRLTAVPWLEPDIDLWKLIPQSSHKKLVNLIELVGIPEKQKTTFYESALANGSVEARRAAAEYRVRMTPERFEQQIKNSLNNPDPEIEAWAVSELQHTNISDKSRLLVERLDSPHESVQKQARLSLGKFTLQHAIDYCESSSHAAGRRIAELLLKIDPQAIQKLSRELANPIRTRRLQAAKATFVMGLHLEVQKGLIELLYDSDPIIRRTAIEILAETPNPQIVSLLITLLEDPNPRVRTATEQALKNIRKNHSEKKPLPAQTKSNI